MRRSLLAAALLAIVLAAACGSSSESAGEFDERLKNADGGAVPGFGPGGDDPPSRPCVGLECKRVACGGGATTSVSGVVWDPAGKNPLYNVVVYVPNAPLEPINHGPVCDSCGGAPVSGSPVAATLTDATGAFKLENIPVAENIPLVMQAGKWRRQITIPGTPKQCEDNPITDSDQTRLPKSKSEGDMPLIALTGGCDPIHTLIRKIGVEPSEFTDANGAGMVRVYKGAGYNGGVSSATDAYAFWGSLSEMMKYDIIINECECDPHPRDTKGPAYENMQKFLDAGGRVFNSHYHLNFFGASSENKGRPTQDLQSAANWTLWDKTSMKKPFLIDTSFPKGKAMDEWLTHLQSASKWGPSIKTSEPGSINLTSVAGDIGGVTPGISQRWIYPASGNGAVYVSFNTPTSKPPEQRCGRAVATDLHVGSSNLNVMIEQEAALEFIFFDLASCVIDDAIPPSPPGPK